ncbi:MAG: Crp/Fnr family transcriptional regulator [Sphingomicrobium sp.]
MSKPPSEPYRGKNPLIRKLGRFVPLTQAECEVIEQVCQSSHQHRQGSDLIQQGDKPRTVFLILKGWAFRYKQLEDGSRQIMAYLLPGDLCDIQILLFEKMDHSIGLLSDAEVVKIPAAEILDLMDRFPRIERALMWATLVDEATLREWLLNVGQRSALQRLAHLFCELCVRLSVVGLVDEDESFVLPLTQTELADTTGLSTVHVNRTLQRLRKDNLISTLHGRLTILNPTKLAEIAGFNNDYLHTDGPPVEQQLRARVSQSM